jgi:hypothetical protein
MVPLLPMSRVPGVAAGNAGHQAVAVDGFGAGENIGMASMPLSFAVAGDGEAV